MIQHMSDDWRSVDWHFSADLLEDYARRIADGFLAVESPREKPTA
jgi:hypothetical protein